MSTGALADLLADQATSLVDYGGAATPRAYGEVEAEWRALDAGCGLLDLGYRRTILARGEERAEFLQGQLSNDVVGLEPGRGCAALALNSQGRVQAMLSVYDYGDALALDVDAAALDATRARLEQFLVADDVELEILPATDRIGVAGPDVLAILAEVGLGDADADPADVERSEAAPRELDSVGSEPRVSEPRWFTGRRRAGDLAVRLHGRGDLRVPFVELLVERGEGSVLWRALEQAGASAVGVEAFEIVRVESGTARWDADVDASRVAVEARLEWAIHFSKGCYVGQEIVERAVSRGRINRVLSLLATDEMAAAGDRVAGAGDKDIVRSAVRSPRAGALCLAYVPREASEAGTELSIVHGDAEIAARVVAWPRQGDKYVVPG